MNVLAWLRGRRPTDLHVHGRTTWLGWTLEFSTANESSARTIHRWLCRCGETWVDVSAWSPSLEDMARQERDLA